MPHFPAEAILRISATKNNSKAVADSLGITKKTLLNWLKRGKIPEPARDATNDYRVWTEEDIARIRHFGKRLK